MLLELILGTIVGGGVVGFLINHYSQKRIRGYKEEIVRLNQKLQEKEICESEIHKLRVEIESLVGRKIDLETEIDELDSLASKHQSDLRDISQEFEEMKTICDETLKKSQEAEKVSSQLLVDIDKLTKSKGTLAEKIHSLKNERYSVSEQLSELKSQLVSVEHDFDLQQHGLYEPLYDFGTAQEYKERLKGIRDAQKQMFQAKTAITCSAEWSVDGSRREGKKMTTEKIKLMANAFNGCCDSVISRVKYSNVASIEKKINKAFDDINKLGATQRCSISNNYLHLKLSELQLVHEYQEKLQEEKEERAEIARRLREEESAQKELEKAKLLAEKEERNYQKALEKARKEFEGAATDNRKNTEKLRDKITQLEQSLREATGNKLRALSRAEVTSSGYIYIISNIGSFGKDIYKIGLTRRLEPENRIRELSGAAVPFKYDVHALIFSENAPKLENTLHRALEEKRVNLVNKRKEFFNCSLEAIKDICHQHEAGAKFFDMPVAEEFRKTKAMRRDKVLNLN
ncbi:DUF4041 domain-containing protein [Candidatus Poribacteria bacterium]|nr:DUF4041 domain-containing protein [Candidatus Poribacteria bacterium]